nr:MAG TPA: hypothetical protein [Caudoviricetes sp.]
MQAVFFRAYKCSAISVEYEDGMGSYTLVPPKKPTGTHFPHSTGTSSFLLNYSLNANYRNSYNILHYACKR